MQGENALQKYFKFDADNEALQHIHEFHELFQYLFPGKHRAFIGKRCT